MKLIIVRHGLTDYNVQGIMQGHVGTSLNEAGLEQAKKLALRFKEEKIDFVYVSDLKRAVQTASEILAYHPHLSPVFTQEIRERYYGIFDGKHRDFYLAERDRNNTPDHEFKPEGGESVIEARARGLKFFNTLKEKHLGATVLMVSHGSFLRAMLGGILNEDLATGKHCNTRQGNTAVTILDVSDGNCVVNLFNCTKHLE